MLGRRDATTANFEGADNLPGPTDALGVLREKFASLGLDDTDFVALQGLQRRPNPQISTPSSIHISRLREFQMTYLAIIFQEHTRSAERSAGSSRTGSPSSRTRRWTGSSYPPCASSARLRRGWTSA